MTIFSRERENLLVEQKDALAEFEGERAQLLAQLQVLEEQLQEKGRQLQETEAQVGALLVIWERLSFELYNLCLSVYST